MSVRFENVLFNNLTGIDLLLTVELADGAAYGPQTAPANQQVTVPISRDDCLFTVLTVSDGGHENYKQTFATAPGYGVPSYLVSVEVQYNIGDIYGRMTCSIGDAPSPSR